MKKMINYALFVVVVLLAISSMYNRNEYINNIGHAVVIPLFIISILDVVNKLKEYILDELSQKLQIISADYREADAMSDVLKYFEDVDDDGKIKGWRNKRDDAGNDMEIIIEKIEHTNKMFSIMNILYLFAIVILFLFMLFAQSNVLIDWLKCINGDSITLWTFSILLFDISFTKYIAKKLLKIV